MTAISSAGLASQSGVALDVVTTALAEERAVLLIDGLDEAPRELRCQLTAALARFTASYPTMPVLVTSRPSGAPGEIEACLPGFRGYHVADLTEKEVESFIDKWCLAAETSSRPNSSEAGQQATVAAADLKARIKRSRPVERIAVNPLLTTILCVVHRFLGRTIPEHRVTLYEKCTDALLYEWDRAKFPKDAAVGNLDANQKRACCGGSLARCTRGTRPRCQNRRWCGTLRLCCRKWDNPRRTRSASCEKFGTAAACLLSAGQEHLRFRI